MNQPTLNFIHLCEAASADSLNKLSVLGIYNIIYLPSVPNKFPKITLVCSINLGNSLPVEHNVTLKLYNAKREELKTPPIDIKFSLPKDDKNTKKREINLILELQGIEFFEFGDHKFEILIDKHVIGGKEFGVEQRV